jgi:hypothetical protein
MATKYINIGSSVGVFGYDDATFVNAIETTSPIKVDAIPTDSAHVLRLNDLGGLTVSAVEVVNIDDPSAELNGLSSTGGTILMAYQVGAAGDAFTYYAWDTAVAAGEDVPFIVDGTGGFWIAVAGKYSALDVTIKNLTPSEKLNLPMGEISYFSTTGTAIAIATVSDGSTNMVKVDPVTTLNNEMEFDNGGADDGRLRYIGAATKTFHVASTISFAPATANDVFVVGIAKNGTVIVGSKILAQATTANGIRSTALHSMISLANNDYVELYVGNITDADDFVIHTLNIFAMGM